MEIGWAITLAVSSKNDKNMKFKTYTFRHTATVFKITVLLLIGGLVGYIVGTETASTNVNRLMWANNQSALTFLAVGDELRASEQVASAISDSYYSFKGSYFYPLRSNSPIETKINGRPIGDIHLGKAERIDEVFRKIGKKPPWTNTSDLAQVLRKYDL